MSFYPTTSIARCQHIKVNGTLCGSPALNRRRYCFFHQQYREQTIRINTRARRQARSLNLPVLEDANSIQITLMQVMRLILTGQIDSKVAGLLLYALQTASVNLKNTQFEPRQPENVVIDPRTVVDSILGEQLWDRNDYEDEEEDEEAEDDAEEAAGSEEEAGEEEAGEEEAADDEEAAPDDEATDDEAADDEAADAEDADIEEEDEEEGEEEDEDPDRQPAPANPQPNPDRWVNHPVRILVRTNPRFRAAVANFFKRRSNDPYLDTFDPSILHPADLKWIEDCANPTTRVP